VLNLLSNFGRNSTSDVNAATSERAQSEVSALGSVNSNEKIEGQGTQLASAS
jgi:hypothetical protein